MKLRGLHMMGSYILRMVHVQGTTQGLYAVLLRVENVQYLCFWFKFLLTPTIILLRNTIIRDTVAVATTSDS